MPGTKDPLPSLQLMQKQINLCTELDKVTFCFTNLSGLHATQLVFI